MISAVIPTRDEPTPQWYAENITMRTLRRQTIYPFPIFVIHDRERKGAPWSRNQGFSQVRTEYVLFSDDDIDWSERAAETMLWTAKRHPEASWIYCAYRSNWIGPEIHTIGFRKFDPDLLKQKNYISTMSLVRCRDFPGFDENLQRHQDWDLWLTMAGHGKTGVFCGHVLFETRITSTGVTFGSIPIDESKRIIRHKHGLTRK